MTNEEKSQNKTFIIVGNILRMKTDFMLHCTLDGLELQKYSLMRVVHYSKCVTELSSEHDANSDLLS